MIRRKLGAGIAVSALILASILAGGTAAFAAPAPPLVDQTFADPWITASDQPSVQGSNELGTSQIDVEASQDGLNYTPYCSIPQSPSGTVWYCSSPTGTLALGTNYIRAIATDAVPASSAPGPAITITVVNAPTITGPADGLYTNDYQPTFQGTSDGTYFDVYSSDFTTHFCGGTVVNQTWNCTSGTVPDGDYTYLVQTTFGATTIFSSTRTLHIDTVLSPPNTDITGPAGTVDGSGELHSASTDPNPTISGIAEPGSTIYMWQNYSEVACQGGAPVADNTGAWSCTLAVALPTSGVYVFGSQQTDPAGNTNYMGSPDEQLALTYTDTTPPMPPVVTSPIGNVALGTNTVITNSTGATVTGTGEPGATLDIVGNACMITPTIVDASGNWTCQLTTPMTPDGTYDVFFGQTDAALNSSPLASPYIHFDVDTIAPGAPSVTTPSGPSSGGVMRASTKETHPVITGTGEYGATARIYVGGSAPVACDESPLVIGEGGFTCTVKNTLSPGVYYFGFSQTDAAGNSSGAPVVRLQLTVVAPPPAPVILPTLGLNWFLRFASDSNAPAPGQNVTLTGSDLPAGATVSAELHSTPVDLGTAMVRDDGTFTLNTVIPSTVEPGAHHYVVTVTPLTGEPQTSELPVTVVAAPPPAIPQPVVPASPTDGGTTTGTGDPVGSESRDTPSSPNQLSNALPTLQDIISNPVVIGAAAASSLALLFLVAFPAEILNSTLDENYERIFGRIPRVRMPWLARLRDRLKRTPAVGGLALTTLAALILSFADPRFGFDLASLRLFLACAIGMFVLGFIANAVTGIILKRRWNITSVIELQPFGLVVAIVGVVLSRALDFAPGLLVGLVLGLSLSASASLKEESRAVLTWFGVILGLSVLGWIGYSFFSGVVAPGTFAGALVDDSIVAIATEGISGLVIGLLPIGFLDGRTVFRNSRWQWIGTYVLTLVAFFVIVVPSGALWGDISGPFWIWLVVLLAFAALCIGVYLWFRAHPESEDDAAVDADSAQSDSDISDRDKSVHQY